MILQGAAKEKIWHRPPIIPELVNNDGGSLDEPNKLKHPQLHQTDQYLELF